jgi:hypothetical protein
MKITWNRLKYNIAKGTFVLSVIGLTGLTACDQQQTDRQGQTLETDRDRMETDTWADDATGTGTMREDDAILRDRDANMDDPDGIYRDEATMPEGQAPARDHDGVTGSEERYRGATGTGHDTGVGVLDDTVRTTPQQGTEWNHMDTVQNRPQGIQDQQQGIQDQNHDQGTLQRGDGGVGGTGTGASGRL